MIERGAAKAVVDVREAFCLYPSRHGAVAALRGLSLSVAPGEKVVIRGPNGSGKTTLMQLLVDEQQLSAGEATVAGRAVGRGRHGGDQWRARTIGWVDQFPARTLRPELSLLDNIGLQLRILGASVSESRSIAHATLGRIGGEQLATRTIEALSGGEAQRGAVAAALAHRPALVLADEPCGQLDADSADVVYRALADGVRETGSALVLVSHDRRAEAFADRVLYLRDGRASEVRWTADRRGGDTDDLSSLLVVDDRGWVRLPEAMRTATSTGDALQVYIDYDTESIVLRPPHRRRHAERHGVEPVAAADPEAQLARTRPPTDGGRIPLSVTDVSRTISGRSILSRASIEVASGTVHVVAGRSGSGKSTLLRIMTGLERADSGTVRLGDVELGELDREQLAGLRRQSVGMALQEIHLVESVSLIENLAVIRAVRGMAPDRSEDQYWLDRLGIGHLAPRRATTCSGGERQRLALARALVGQPPVVVFDEPSSQLDEAAVEHLATVLRDVARAGAAVVVATHDEVLIDRADAVLWLDRPDIGTGTGTGTGTTDGSDSGRTA